MGGAYTLQALATLKPKTMTFNSLRFTFFGDQQIRNGLEIEGDLMRLNIYKIILYEVQHLTNN